MKKIGCFLFCVLICCCVPLVLSANEPTVARDITKKNSFQLISGSGSVSRLSDRTVTTACSTKEYFELQITSEEPIFGIYLIWNHTPPQWTITNGLKTITGGEYGFWHEYKALSGGTRYTLTWSGEGYLADVYLLGEGETLPEFVQVWEPPCEKADLLLLPTHADDEHLWFGGTMPYYAGELGYEVQVVYLMKHVYGRHHELINGLWKVGVTNYPVISEFIDKYCANLDQAKAYYPEEEVLAFLVENIRRFKPEVIIGHDLDGEYGHGAHILNATVLSGQALSAANDPAQFPESLAKYGVWETKKCYLHLYQENEIFMDWKSMSLSAFGGINAYDMAQAGFNEHVSQRTFFSMSLENRARYGNGLFGLYSSTVGPDVLKNDFLENIPAECLSDWVPPEPDLPATDTELENYPSSDSDSSETMLQSNVVQSDSPKWVIIVSAVFGVAGLVCIVGSIILFHKKR